MTTNSKKVVFFVEVENENGELITYQFSDKHKAFDKMEELVNMGQHPEITKEVTWVTRMVGYSNGCWGL